jgi:hypothetical protein
MPATNLEELYEFENLLELGFKGILDDYPRPFTGFQIVTQRGATELATPRIEIQVQMGRELDHFSDAAKGQLQDITEFILGFQVTTARVLNDAEHAIIRAKIRAAVANWALMDASARRFTYYEIVKLTGSGTQPVIENEDGTDSSVIGFSGVMGIRNDAWPTA